MKQCEHEWVERYWPDDDYCRHCGVTWVEWAKGFGSNVQPKTTKKGRVDDDA